MIKKIFCFIACFMLVLSCVFISPISANASTGQTYTYDDSEVYSDTSNLGNYAIQDIESLTVNGAVVFKATFTLSNSDYFFRFISRTNSQYSLSGNYFFYNSEYVYTNQIDCNFAIRCLTSSTGISLQSYGDSYGKINNVSYYYRYVRLTANQSFEIYFSSATFGGTYSNMTYFSDEFYNSRLFNKVFNYSDYDLSVFNDMNSETNFTYGNIFYDFLFVKYSPYFSNFLFIFRDISIGLGGMPSLTSGYTSSDLSSYTIPNSSCSLYKDSTLILDWSFDYFVSTSSGVAFNPDNDILFDYNFLYKDFYFSVLRPVYRTNNTLIIYNYDYDNLLINVSNVTYQLQKGNDKYNVVYNGSLPNSTFIYVSNNRINNILFDSYIYVYLSFGNGNLINYSFIPFGSLTSDTYDMGFDFNFTYYNEPLVSSNGSYNFDFQKPGYVDMRFSLAPFYIPILEAVQNALIFLLFYCPIISDILAFIHLDQFFGALFNIFGFETGNITLLGINMGSFVWACISFLIFFKLLRSFMPILWSSRAEASSSWSDLMSKPDKLREKERIAHHKEIYRKHKENLKAKKSDKVKIRGRVYSKKYFDSLYDNIDDIDL